MALPAPYVGDPLAQLNFDVLGNLGQFVSVTSSTVQGPSALSNNLLYTGCTLTLAAGTWLVYAQATMSSQNAADSKSLALQNITTNAFITGSNGPVLDAPAVNVAQAFSTAIVLTLPSNSQLRMLGIRNGTSQVTIGFSGAINPTQRMTALRIN